MRKLNLRQNGLFKFKEAESQKIRRQNAIYKHSDKVRKVTLRSKDEFKLKENLRRKIIRQNLNEIDKKKYPMQQNITVSRWRSDKFNKLCELIANKRRMKLYRYDRFYRLKTNKKVCRLVSKLRKNVNERKILLHPKFNVNLSTRLHFKFIEQLQRSVTLRNKNDIGDNIFHKPEHEVIQSRRVFAQYLHEKSIDSSSSMKVRNIKLFLNDRSETPKYICVSCEGFFFYYSVSLTTENEIYNLAPENSMFKTKYICSTCRSQF